MESLLQTPVPPVPPGSKLKKISKYAPLTAQVQKTGQDLTAQIQKTGQDLTAQVQKPPKKITFLQRQSQYGRHDLKEKHKDPLTIQQKIQLQFGTDIIQGNVQNAKNTLQQWLDRKYEKNILLSQIIGKTGMTALHFAVDTQNIDMINFLLENGADINDPRKLLNNTPLHIAVEKELTDIVDLLLKKDANKELKNSNGKTPLDLATEKKNIPIISLLMLQELHSIKSELLTCIYTYLYKDWEKNRSSFHGWWTKDKIDPKKFKTNIQRKLGNSESNTSLIQYLKKTSNLTKRKTVKKGGKDQELQSALTKALNSIDAYKEPTLKCNRKQGDIISLQGSGVRKQQLLTL